MFSLRSWAILVLGIVCGFITFIPNGCLADSGTTRAYFAAYIGITASLLFIIGGVYGFVTDSGWWVLLPAVGCQVAAFTVPALIREKPQSNHPDRIVNA